jgi:hypothetical protein
MIRSIHFLNNPTSLIIRSILPSRFSKMMTEQFPKGDRETMKQILIVATVLIAMVGAGLSQEATKTPDHGLHPWGH